MIYIKNLEDPLYLKSYEKTLENRSHPKESIKEILEINELRKKHTLNIDTKKSEQKKMGQQLSLERKKGEDCSHSMDCLQKLKDEVKELEKDLSRVQDRLSFLLSHLPNKCHESVPVGFSEKENRVEKYVGEKPTFSFKAQTHYDIAEKRSMVDFSRASKVSGARFSFLIHWGAKLERALANFMLDLHTKEHGYTEVIPPFLVNTESLFGTGQFPKFAQDVFHIKDFPYFLIPTAEAPMTNYYRDELLDESHLPRCFAAYSSCFRSEAGSYGKDTKGLMRQHQFEKVELMSFVHPDSSYEAHEKLTCHAEEILHRLELPYRRVSLCTSDLSFSAAKCFDLEVWLPGEQAYREISSCSNFEDFQARRIQTRFRPKNGGKPRFVHTLNGSGLALGRTVIAVIENYQREDGSVKVPQVLEKYLGVKVL